ncbi:hypothetical protein WJX72_007845 [[Myrmecia] bisecta]|uniref:Uncharacterized protein n=1 Tax=[Myrmecia] bisecta TaxID=41462 RepID=A0AAW1QRN7_9CHLO
MDQEAQHCSNLKRCYDALAQQENPCGPSEEDIGEAETTRLKVTVAAANVVTPAGRKKLDNLVLTKEPFTAADRAALDRLVAQQDMSQAQHGSGSSEG